jgi:hypothetical protein
MATRTERCRSTPSRTPRAVLVLSQSRRMIAAAFDLTVRETRRDPLASVGLGRPGSPAGKATMSDVDLEKLLEPHAKELESLAEAAAKGDHDKVIDGASSLVLTLATGNPVIGALAPLARRGIAKAFGNAADEMFARELAAMQKEEDRKAFFAQIDDVVAALVGQALIQLVRTQHNVKDEVLTALGGVREDFERFRADFGRRVSEQGETVRIDEQVVEAGGIGVRVRASTTKRVALKHQVVSGTGSVGIDLG